VSRVLWWAFVLFALALASGCSGRGTPQAPSALAPRETQEPAGEKAGITWSYDFEAGLAQARESGKPLMVDVFATWCAPCKRLDEEVFSRADVTKACEDFVTVRVDGDEHRGLVDKLKVSAYPTVLFLMPDGTEIRRSIGVVSYRVMLEEMAKAKTNFAGRSG
jgi:thiol:disulfide interchange protein